MFWIYATALAMEPEPDPSWLDDARPALRDARRTGGVVGERAAEVRRARRAEAEERAERWGQLGTVAKVNGEPELAERAYRIAWATAAAAHGTDAPEAVGRALDLAGFLSRTERADEARVIFEGAMQILPPGVDRARASIAYGDFLVDEGREDEADALVASAFEGLGDAVPAEICIVHGSWLLGRGDLDGATAWLDRAMVAAEGDPADLVDALVTTAELQYAQGEAADALELLTRARDLLDAGAEPDEPWYAWFVIGRALHEVGRMGEAEAAFARTLETSRQVLGEDHPNVAVLTASLAATTEQRDPEAADALYRRAIELQERAFGGDNPEVAVVLFNHGVFLEHQRGDLQGARAALRRSRDIARAALGDASPMTLRIERSLANLLVREGRYDEATQLLEQGVEALRAATDDPLDLADAQTSLAHVYKAQGRLDDAARLVEQNLEVRRERLGEDAGLVMLDLNLLASIEQAQGRYAAAEEHYRRAIRGLEDAIGPEALQTRATRSNLAGLYYITGRFVEAEPLIRRDVDHVGAHPDQAGPDHWITLNTLGLVLQGLDRNEEALAVYLRSLELAGSTLGDDHPDVVTLISNIGTVHRDLGDLPAAERWLRRSMDTSIRTSGPNHPSRAIASLNLARVLAELDRPDEARELFGTVMTLTLLQEEPELRREAHRRYAEFLHDQDELPAAVFHGKAAVRIAQQLRADAFAMTGRARRTYTGELARTYRTLAEILVDQGDVDGAEQVLELLRTEEQTQFLQKTPTDLRIPWTEQERIWTEQLDELQAPLDGIRTELAELRARRTADPASLSADDKATLRHHEKQALAFQKALLAFLDEVRAEADRTGRGATIDDLDLPSVQRRNAALASSPGTGWLTVLWTSDRVHLLLSSASGTVHRSVDIDQAELRGQVGRWRALLQDPSTDPVPLARSLYDVLVAPIEEEVGRLDRLWLSLDGELRYLPFGALHDGDGYLVERLEIRRVVAGAPASPTAGPRRFAVAAFGTSRGHDVDGRSFSALPSVPAELAAVAGGSGDVLLLDDRFTRAQLQHLAPQAARLHVASHFVLGSDLERSALLLGDGTLWTLADLRADDALDLTGVELLALSACETAVTGAGSDGRELDGLAQIAREKGAGAVLATLWPVADRSTAALMTELYAQLRRGQPAATALREAQRSFVAGGLRDDGSLASADRSRGLALSGPARSSGTWDHPYYWAPFVLLAQESGD